MPPLSIPSTSKNISSLDERVRMTILPRLLMIPPSAPQLPKWVCTTRDATGALAGDPTDRRRTHS